jgi:hypothetical protein
VRRGGFMRAPKIPGDDAYLEQISFCLNRGDSRRFVNERVYRH